MTPVAHAERLAAVAADDPVIVDRGGDPDLLLCGTTSVAALRERIGLAATVVGA